MVVTSEVLKLDKSICVISAHSWNKQLVELGWLLLPQINLISFSLFWVLLIG